MTTTLLDLGFNQINGRRAKGCVHMAAWWPWFRLVVLLRTGLDVNKLAIQMAGDAPASAGYHAAGTCFDLRTRGYSVAKRLQIIAIAREAGARATWFRNWVNNQHLHGALDCPCTTPADSQLRAVDRGRDGLVGNGPDTHPNPSKIRNHATGLAWLMAQLEEPDMPMPTAQQIADAVLASPVTANGKKQPLIQHFAELVVYTAAQSNAVGTEAKRDNAQHAAVVKKLDALTAQVADLTKKVGAQ